MQRFWKIFTNDSPSLFGAGLLAIIGSLVYILGMILSVSSHALLPMLIAGPLGGMIAAPQLCGMVDTVLRSLRDESGAWWATYRRAWKQNVKEALLPGAVEGLIFGFQLFIVAQANRVSLNLVLLVTMVLGIVVATAIATWFLPQLVLMKLPSHRMLINSVLLCVRHPLRTLGAVLLQLVYWGFIALAYPYSLFLFLLLNFWLPTLAATMLIYPPLEDTFHIEEEVEALQDDSDEELP